MFPTCQTDVYKMAQPEFNYCTVLRSVCTKQYFFFFHNDPPRVELLLLKGPLQEQKETKRFHEQPSKKMVFALQTSNISISKGV